MRGFPHPSEPPGEASRTGERDPSSVGYADTFSHKGRRIRRSCHHGAGAMTVRVAAVRAPKAGRYMSLAWAPGSRKSPGVTARAT